MPRIFGMLIAGFRYYNKTMGFHKTFIIFFLILISSRPLLAAHGISMDGELKYPADFKKFDYCSSQAERGGRIVLHDLGGFDKLNPFTFKGEPPFGLEMLVFEPLAVASLDEPFSEYGLLARDIDLAEDGLSVTYTLNENARFSDGTPVTVEDVAYTLTILKGKKVHPFYPYYYKDIIGSKIIAPGKIRFNFARKNRELHLIASQMRVLSRRFYEQSGFGVRQKGSQPAIPVGSGPYIIDQVRYGKSITYKKNPHYWAKEHPVRKGMYNYEKITVKYFKDQTIALEAFKAGEFDYLPVNIAKQWARDMKGPKFDSGEIVKKNFIHFNNAGMQCFVMNTRRPLFKNRLVRQALGLALDFEWINRALFFDQYTRSKSFFSNSPLAAKGLPTGLELEYLEQYRPILPEDVFLKPLSPPRVTRKNSLRQNLKKAKGLLAAAGWKVKNNFLVNGNGKKFQFEILLVSPSFERVMAPYVTALRKLGIDAKYRTVDQTLYVERLKKFDFDMIVTTFSQSLSPGNEQRNYWHSSSASRRGSKNYAGIRSEAVDGLVDRIIYAENCRQLSSACKALDRVLWYGYYVVPNWYLGSHRISYYSKIHFPAKLPLYYDPTQLLMISWMEKTQ